MGAISRTPTKSPIQNSKSKIQNPKSKIKSVLSELNISNFAIIDNLYLRLGQGFNALTGETGAGKSIIIDALGALLGSKVGPEFVRHGSPSARVNGRMVNLPALQQIGELLVDVHGQSEHVSLHRPATHIDLLDQYAGLSEERAAMAGLVSRLRATQKELRELQRDERELARRVDLLTYQVEDIDKAAPQPGEDEDLANERSRLANSERLSSICDALYALLIESGDDDPFAARPTRGAAPGRYVRDNPQSVLLLAQSHDGGGGACAGGRSCPRHASIP